jgi:hypothetical protein
LGLNLTVGNRLQRTCRATPTRTRASAAVMFVLLAVIFSAAPIDTAATAADVVENVIAQVDAGQFAAAEAGIVEATGDARLDAPTRTALEFQRERMRRILLDFKLTEAALKAKVREQIPDLTDVEFADWNARGMSDRDTFFDGRVLYFARSPSNLYRLSAQARDRRKGASRSSTVRWNRPTHTMSKCATRRSRNIAAASRRAIFALPNRSRSTPTQCLRARRYAPGFPTARVAGTAGGPAFRRQRSGENTIAPEATMQRTVFLEKPRLPASRRSFPSLMN